ncbi:MAG: hypothetical protein ACREKL_04045 [Chthoniobacterales bacterium]
MKNLSTQGSAILMAVLLIAVAGVLTAGAIGVLMARRGMVEQMLVASQRRISLENSKALAQEFMLEHVMISASGSGVEYSLSPASLGGITMPSWNSAPLQSVQKAAGVNHFNPGNGDGYTLDLTATVRDSASSFQRKYQVKSRSPLLAGTLLASQAPTITSGATISIGGLDVDGGAFIWRPGLSMTFTPDSYSVPDGSTAVTFANSAGTTLAPNDLALPLQIANPRNGAALIYSGQLDAINNSNAAANSSVAKVTSGAYKLVDGSVVDNDATDDGITCDGSGVVTITLSTLELGNVYIPGEISTLILTGQTGANDSTADAMPSILIVVDQASTSSRDLTQITLNDHNSRRVDLAVKKAASVGNLPVQFSTSSANWRMLLELENTPVAVTAPGIATLRGGIRSDRSIILASGAIRLTLDSDPKYLDQLATRTAWIESYAQ